MTGKILAVAVVGAFLIFAAGFAAALQRPETGVFGLFGGCAIGWLASKAVEATEAQPR